MTRGIDAAKAYANLLLARQQAGHTNLVIPPQLRTKIFRIQEFAAIFACSTREIAKACFYTGRGNYMCAYHAEHRSQTDTDSTAGESIGVPGERILAESSDKPVTPSPGCFHCGCKEEYVLFEFFLWKVWYVQHKVNGETVSDCACCKSNTDIIIQVTEGLGLQRFEPRLREFICQNYFRQAGIRLQDVYEDDAKMAFLQIQRLLLWYNRENSGELGEQLVLTRRALPPKGEGKAPVQRN